jgi:hypothetical protein
VADVDCSRFDKFPLVFDKDLTSRNRGGRVRRVDFFRRGLDATPILPPKSEMRFVGRTYVCDVWSRTVLLCRKNKMQRKTNEMVSRKQCRFEGRKDVDSGAKKQLHDHKL